MNCTNPSAVNYDNTATRDDGSCIYLEKINGVCHAFQDIDPALTQDNSFTMSFSVENDNWVFYHDYWPDMYVHTREKLYNLSGNRIYQHNAGPYGAYHSTGLHSFFIDVAFPSRTDDDFTVDAIQWITSVLNAQGKTQEGSTLTHITVWNDRQCTGRIPLSNVFDLLEYKTDRETKGVWNFDVIRDALADQSANFLDTLFNNFSILTAAIDANIPWYEQQLLSDNHVVVRFEFDNVSARKILVHKVDINTTTSTR